VKKWLEEKFKLLNPKETKDKNGGYTRLGYSKEEQLAINAFITIAKELNLNIYKDEIGNVIATWPGKIPKLPNLSFGSHLDTVKNGGAYDGVAGVLAGLGVIKLLKSLDYKPTRSIEIICFISEESSRFGVSTIGSKAMTGMLGIDNLKDLTDENSVKLEEAMKSQGIIIEEIMNAKRNEMDLHSFIELHIEQGEILQNSKKNIGIVTGIASPLRYKVYLNGEASHTGTTPMDKRKDALATAGKLITFIEELGKKSAKKDHFVATVTTVDVSPNVMNVIPETVLLGLDIRSTNDELKKESEKLLIDYCNRLSASNGVEIKLVEIANEQAVILDQNVIRDLKEAAKISNLSFTEIASGAGHDAMNMAAKWPTGMIFIPCKDGKSHHPHEYAEISDIFNGIQVLSNYVKRIDEKVEMISNDKLNDFCGGRR
jgi:hydantoinase/carbamoylase family amidase